MSDIYVGQLVSSNILEHHGILGMKWGVRRYQKPDGTLTVAGKKRYERTNWNGLAVAGARKDYKRSDGKNTSKIRAKYQAKIDKVTSRHSEEVERLHDGWDSIEGRKVATRQLKEVDALIRKATYELRKAKLVDAGYSKESAEAGAQWMSSHGFNIDYDDKHWKLNY